MRCLLPLFWRRWDLGLGHALISSWRWIRPLLRSRKSTCASLYLVMTSTNLRDRTECCGQGQGCEDGDRDFGMGMPHSRWPL